jgi:hypothetical protein
MLEGDLLPVAEVIQNEALAPDPWVAGLEGFESRNYYDNQGTKLNLIDRYPVEGTNREELRVSNRDVLTYVIGKPLERQTQGDCARLSAAMKAVDWQGTRAMRVFGKNVQAYYKEIIKPPVNQPAPEPDDPEVPF